MDYQSEVYGTNMGFKAEFDFSIANNPPEPGVFNYDHSKLDRTGIADLKQKAFEEFNLPWGTAFFIAPLLIPGTLIPNVVVMSNTNREFILDGGMGIVVFMSKGSNGSNYVHSMKIPFTGSDKAVISLSWTTNDSSMSVDGISSK
jgi:hypothetical protein